MKVNKFAFFLLLLPALLGRPAAAQTTEAEPLDSLLLYLGDRFNVVFTYADVNVKGISATLPQGQPSLDACLNTLEQQTDLRFSRINARYIAVYKVSGRTRLSGIIIDQSTGDKLAAAAVYSGSSHAVSDAHGFFTLPVDPAKDTLVVIRHVGFHPFSIPRDMWDTDTSTYALVPDIQELREVKLNYITRGIRKLPDGALQLNIQNLEVLPGLSRPDVLQAIQILPGVQSINETVSEINTRGGTNDQNLVLWDGVKMYQTGHFFGLISAFNSHLIQQAKVIKNGTSAAYDEGVSGTIDMQQQDFQVKEMEISTGLDMLSADIIARIPVNKKFSFIMGARHSINNLVKTPTYKSYYDRAFAHTEVRLTQPGSDSTLDTYHDFSFYDVNTKLLYDLTEKDQLRLSALYNKNNIAFEERATILDTLYTRQSQLQQSNLLSNLRYTRTWSENQSFKLSAFVSSYFLEGSNVSIADDRYHLQENEVIDWGMKLESDNRIGRIMDLESGYQFKEVGIRNLDNLLRPNYTREELNVLRIHSIYTEATFSELFSKFFARTGIRANYYAKFDYFSFEPRIAVNYRLTRHISIEVLAEKKSQHTTQLIDFQTDFLGVEKRRWVLANNESIPLLNSLQVSAGMQYNGENFLASAEGYMKKVSGIITPSQGFQNQMEYQYAAGDYYARGVELLFNKRFRSANTWITYAISRNNYLFEAFEPSSFPNNLDVRHALSLGGSLSIDPVEISAGFNYRSGKPYTQPAQEQVNERSEIVYEDPNSSRLPDYLRLDLSGKYTFSIHEIKGELGISVWNILNHDNIYNIYYQVNVSDEIEQITQNTLGITPNVSLRFRF